MFYIKCQLIYRLRIKLCSMKGTCKICVCMDLKCVNGKSRHILFIYISIKILVYVLCIIFYYFFPFTKVLYVQTMARGGGTVYIV